MEQEQLLRALKIIAMREGVPEETILSEIESSITEAYTRILSEGDEEKLALWREISPNGVPTVCEFISYTSGLIQNAMDMGLL